MPPGHAVSLVSRCPSITGSVTTRPDGNLSLPSDVTWVQPCGSRSYIASFQPATLDNEPRVAAVGCTVSRFPITQMPVDEALTPRVCAPRTGRSIPPYRPSQIDPKESTRKL